MGYLFEMVSGEGEAYHRDAWEELVGSGELWGVEHEKPAEEAERGENDPGVRAENDPGVSAYPPCHHDYLRIRCVTAAEEGRGWEAAGVTSVREGQEWTGAGDFAAFG